MSTDATTAAPTPAWPAFNPLECRILGVLVEKAKTTPDAYPLSLNALTNGCNQKTNREPVMNVNDDQVEATLEALQQRGLVTKITGSRVDRWRHNLYELWQVDKVELAILTELLLRGAQTEGELRGHATRMEPIEDLVQLRQRLHPLAERKLVVLLGEEGRRGTQIAHGFRTPEELDTLKSSARVEENAPAAALGSGGGISTLAALQAEVNALKDQVAHLQSALNQMREDMRTLRASLGG